MLSASQKDKLLNFADKILWNHSLASYTSFNMGGDAEAIITVSNRDQLQKVLAFCGKEKIVYRIIGKGTNLIVSDAGFSGVVILLAGDFKDICLREEREDRVFLEIGAAVSLTVFCRYCMRHGYAGAEFCYGIPGTLGGAVIMNAGAWGGEIADIIVSVTLADGSGFVEVERDDLDFSYRLWADYQERFAGFAITGAVLECKKSQPDIVKKECQLIMNKRKKAQPVTLPNAGSFFKNPPGMSAGELIDRCGLKGYRMGNVMVSGNHGNFFVNCGGASSGDVVRLMEHVQHEVFKKYGIQLTPEVHFI